MKAFLDTHAAFYLWEGKPERFGPRARDLLEFSALFVSPVVRLELSFLQQIGRIAPGADQVLRELIESTGLVEAEDPIKEIVAEAMSLTWTRDAFDRLIVATARLHRAPLITHDRKILEHCENAVW